MQRFAVPLVLAVGAVALAALRLADITWNVTPLVVGLTALAAAAVSPTTAKPWTAGIVLTAWGAAVLLVRDGPLPGREAPIFMIAIALGAAVAAVLVGSERQDEVVRGTLGTLLGGGLLFYLAFDLAWLQRWWAVAGGLAIAAAVEAARAVRST